MLSLEYEQEVIKHLFSTPARARMGDHEKVPRGTPVKNPRDNIKNIGLNYIILLMRSSDLIEKI